jgi:aspartyl-tRNA(Asn)/glutamyl-tRNA(Gln) amidotransferase subunit C
MYLNERDVRGIATYARISLDSEQITAMTEDLNNIIESLKPITEYELDGVEPTFHPIAALSNVMREDVEAAGLERDFALSDASEVVDGQFKIPPILGDGGGDR